MLKKVFSDKRFRYGAFSTLICVLVAALVFSLNAALSLFDMRIDLTAEGRYTISDESREILRQITEPVTIYALRDPAQKDIWYDELLAEYERASGYITVEYRDPIMNPSFVEAYKTADEDIPTSSIIVQSASRHRVILRDDLFTREIDPATGAWRLRSFDLEPRVTNAIRFVTADIQTFIYHVTNHNETPLPASILKQISMANYEVKDLDLFAASEIPADADMLLLTTPGRDYSPDEVQKVFAYLRGGGQALIFADTFINGIDNFLSILEEYCILPGRNIVFDASLAHSANNNPLYLAPAFSNHVLMTNMPQNARVLMIYGSSLAPAANVRNSIKIEPLLLTSRQSYAKTGDFENAAPQEGDETGPFALAVAVTDEVYQPEVITTRLIITGSSSLINDTANLIVSGGNGDFMLNAIDWLAGRDDTMFIRPKMNLGETLTMTNLTARVLQVVSMYVMPALIIITGIIVWRKRRNR